MSQFENLNMTDIINASVLSSIATTCVISFIIFLFRNWIIRKIQYSVKHSYDKCLIEVETQKEIRHKAELIAELLSEWINKNEDKQKLNELAFKAFLWLPPDIAAELSSILSHKNDAPNVRDIINKVRKHLLSDNDTLEAWQVIVFPVVKKKE